MSEFQIESQTNGGFSPVGLPKIFISNHPDDDAVRQAVIRDIWNVSECTVYYPQQVLLDHGNLEELDPILQEMSLIVVLLTAKYLQECRRFGDYVLRTAATLHIPLIPICMEPDLESLLSSHISESGIQYDTLQILAYASNDPTEISYSEKLANSLREILPVSEDYLEIENAFSSKIFLSYRRQERSHVRSLLNTIQATENYYTIAIWYDELLRIGGQWEQEILQMIRRSEVFLLVATPSVLDEGNYCLTTEFPEAKRFNLDLMCVQGVQMDQKTIDSICKEYPGIGTMVDVSDVETLRTAFGKYAAQEEPDPKKKYYMGLAFLNGLNVARNSEIALKLIVSAAEAGELIAMEKLGDMYRTGSGTAIDYPRAKFWGEKALEYYRLEYTRMPNSQNAAQLIKMYSKHIDLLLRMSDYQKAHCQVHNLLTFVESIHDSSHGMFGSEWLSHAYSLAGSIAYRQHELNRAMDCFQKSCGVQEALMREYPSPERLTNLAVDYRYLGLICSELHKYDKAEKWYSQSLHIRTILHRKLNTKESCICLANIYYDLGNLFRYTDRLGEAETYYLCAQRYLERVRKTGDHHTLQLQYAALLISLGDAALSQNRLTDAQDYLEQGVELGRKLVDEAPLLNHYLCLASGLHSQGILERSWQNYQESVQLFEGSISLLEKVHWQMKSPKTNVQMAKGLFELAGTYKAFVSHEKALQTYKRILQVLMPVIHLDQMDTARCLYAKVLVEIFKFDTYRGKHKLQQAITIAKDLVNRYPEDESHQRRLEQYIRYFKLCYPETD